MRCVGRGLVTVSVVLSAEPAHAVELDLGDPGPCGFGWMTSVL